MTWFKTMLAAALVAALAATSAHGQDDPPTRAQLLTSVNNLKQIGLAIHNYASAASGRIPGDILDKSGKPLLSWRVAILPGVEGDRLLKEFKLDEPWDSDHNKTLIEKMPSVYAPVRVKAKAGETFYQSFAGPKALFEPKVKYKIGNIPDGTSNTGVVFEAAEPMIWSKPAHLPFDEKQPLPKLGGLFDGHSHVLLMDGSVIRMKKNPDERELRKLIMPADGEVTDLDKLEK